MKYPSCSRALFLLSSSMYSQGRECTVRLTFEGLSLKRRLGAGELNEVLGTERNIYGKPALISAKATLRFEVSTQEEGRVVSLSAQLA